MISTEHAHVGITPRLEYMNMHCKKERWNKKQKNRCIKFNHLRTLKSVFERQKRIQKTPKKSK